jgi:hypothetical protein
MARFAGMEEDASIHGHRFQFRETAVWASEKRFKNNRHTLTVHGIGSFSN